MKNINVEYYGGFHTPSYPNFILDLEGEMIKALRRYSYTKGTAFCDPIFMQFYIPP